MTACCCTPTGPPRRCTRRCRTSSSCSSPGARRRRAWRRPSRTTGPSSTRHSAADRPRVADEDLADAARPDPVAPGASRRRRRRGAGRAPGDPRNVGWLYVLPGLAFYVLFTLAPLLHTVYYSLFSWDGLTAKTWVGLGNYSEAIRDHILLISFAHSAILIVFYAVIPVMLGLLLTAALTRSAIRGFRFFRTVLYLPYLLAGVVIAQAWTWVYDASGPLN